MMPYVALEILAGVLMMVPAPVVARLRIRRSRSTHPTYRTAQVIIASGQEILALLWIVSSVSELAGRPTIDAGMRATLFLLLFFATMFVAATLEGYGTRAASSRGERVE